MDVTLFSTRFTLTASPLGTNNPLKAGMKLARVASIESLFACVI